MGLLKNSPFSIVGQSYGYIKNGIDHIDAVICNGNLIGNSYFFNCISDIPAL